MGSGVGVVGVVGEWQCLPELWELSDIALPDRVA